MLNFKEWILNEAGGAFGHRSSAFDFSRPYLDPRPKMKFSEPEKEITTRDNLKLQPTADRVAFGRNIEKKIITSLKGFGWVIEDASKNEDMYDKIDGWVISNGSRVPLQVKYRDSGDDLLMETIKPWDDTINSTNVQFDGRDMIGKSQLYACLNKAGTLIRVRMASEAKDIAKELVYLLLNQRKTNKVTAASSSKGEARIVNDPKSGESKLNVFIHPEAFKLKKDFSLGKSIWN